MITLKEWNSFTHNTRRRLLEALQLNVDVVDYLCEPYHHNFDYDGKGKILKSYLECFYKQKDGRIKATAYIKPLYDQPARTFTESMAKTFHHTHSEIVRHCEYCGKTMTRSDVNDYGSLCETCYEREYADS